MRLEECIGAAMDRDAGAAVYGEMVADGAAVRLNEDEEALLVRLADGTVALDAVIGWVQWQAAGGVDAQTARESLERVFRAVAETVMDGYAPAEA
jgi:hypothetical protein